MCTGSEAYFLLLYYTKKSSSLLGILSAIPLIKTFFHIMHLYIGVCVLSTVGAKYAGGVPRHGLPATKTPVYI
jgi:hypothetical protein